MWAKVAKPLKDTLFTPETGRNLPRLSTLNHPVSPSVFIETDELIATKGNPSGKAPTENLRIRRLATNPGLDCKNVC